MANCVTCKARCENAGQHRVKTDCISYIPKDYPKTKTNGERLRAMTDEELAEFISTQARTFGEEYEGYMSALDWLEQDVER